MNVALEQTEEYIDGQLTAQYNDTFIRGNNVLYINLQKKKKAAAA
jgi:U6 snRNA-associated Sm-like protein LSm6